VTRTEKLRTPLRLPWKIGLYPTASIPCAAAARSWFSIWRQCLRISVKEHKGVVNSALALLVMSELALERLEQLGDDGDTAALDTAAGPHASP
jgi:hypothetical protein